MISYSKIVFFCSVIPPSMTTWSAWTARRSGVWWSLPGSGGASRLWSWTRRCSCSTWTPAPGTWPSTTTVGRENRFPSAQTSWVRVIICSCGWRGADWWQVKSWNVVKKWHFQSRTVITGWEFFSNNDSTILESHRFSDFTHSQCVKTLNSNTLACQNLLQLL